MLATDPALSWRRLARLCLGLFALALAGAAHAADAPRTFDVPAGDAADTLKLAARQAGLEIVFFAETVRGLRTPPLRGDFAPREALDRLIAGTPLQVHLDDTDILTISRRPSPEAPPFPSRSPSQPSPGMSRSKPLSLLTSLLAFVLGPLPAAETHGPTSASGAARAAAGSIGGTVVNRDTRGYLEGAQVTLLELGRSTLTSREGRYHFAGVPDGSYTVQTFYTGFDSATARVPVLAGAPARADFNLSSEVYRLEKFEVSASQVGDAASITKQRNVANVMNVVSTDAFGNVADGNIGNFLIRLPSMSGDMENGEVTGIRVRGLPPHLNLVNVDGVRAASGLAGFNSMSDRATQVQTIPSEFVKEIELNKAPLPEHPVDSLGGSVNLITKSALDFDNDVFTYRAGINHNYQRRDTKQATPNLALTYLTRRGPNRNLGLALSYTNTDTVAPRDRIDGQRVDADLRNTQARTLANANRRWRTGVGVKLDYKADDATDLYFKFQHNFYKFVRPRTEFTVAATSRLVADYNVVSRAAIEAGATPRTTTGAAAGVAPGFTDTYTELLNARFTHSLAGDSAFWMWQYFYELGGTRQFGGDQKITTQFTYNPSNGRTNADGFAATFTRPIGLSIDARGDQRKPVYRQTYGPGITYGSDLSLYTATMYTLTDRANDDMSNARADYEKQFRGLAYPVKLKSGVAWRRQKKDGAGQSGVPTYQIVGPDGVQGLNATTRGNDDNLAQFLKPNPVQPVRVQGSYPWPAMNDLDFHRVLDLLKTNPGYFKLTAPATPVVNALQEEVTSAYVQSSVQLGHLNVLGGVRFERTEVEALGKNTDSRNPSIATITKDGRYQDYFPSVHFRYDLRKGLVARASYSTSMARPNGSDLYPTTTVTYTGDYGAVTQNNPGLQPQYSDNVDLSLEYYFEPAGLISVGWFHKDIQNFISRSVTTIGRGPGNGFDGKYENFDLNTATNVGSASVKGFEVNYNQNFTLLPKPFNGLSVFGNFAHMKTEGRYNNGVGELDGFVPETANAGVTYRWRDLTTRVSWNYTGDFLRTRNNDINQQLRYRAKSTVDLSLQYQYRPQLGIYVDLVNIGDSWPVWYTGTNPQRVRIADSYGMRANVGVTGRF